MEIVKEGLEKRSKRHLFIEVLKECKAIKECLETLSRKTSNLLQPRYIKKTNLVIIFGAAVFFIVAPYIKFLDFNLTALVILLSFTALGTIYILVLIIFVILSVLSATLFKEKSLYAYWMLLAVNGTIYWIPHSSLCFICLSLLLKNDN